MASLSAEGREGASPLDGGGLPSRESFPRRPLPALVIALMTGMAAGALLPAISPVWPLSGAGIALLASLLPRRCAFCSCCAHLAILLTGFCWMQVEAACPEPGDLGRAISRPRQFVDLAGQVTSQPVPGEPGADGVPVWKFNFRVEALFQGPRSEHASGNVLARMSSGEGGRSPPPVYGDRWRLRGVLKINDKPWPHAQGMAGFLNGSLEQSERLASGGGNPLVAFCFRLREKASERLAWGLAESEPSVVLTRALMLGYREDISRRVYEAFARTGTLHILALSGLHVGILVMLLLVVVKATGLSRPYWVWLFAPLLAMYTVGTGASASMVRASVMSVVFFSAYLLRRKPDAASALALSALVILLADPRQLFQFGFILSFLVVAGLIALVAPISTGLGMRVERESSLLPETPGWKGLRHGWKFVLDCFVVSLAAWLVSFPVMASGFHIVSLSALVVNLPLVPLSSLILFTSSLSLAASCITPWLASVFNHANVLFSECLLLIVEYAARFPGSYHYVPSWPWALIALWYVLLIVWIAGGRLTRWVTGAGLAALVVYAVGQRSWSDDVDVVGVPAGDTIVLLVDGPGNHAMLFDAGPRFAGRSLVEILRGRGISTIDQVWLTRATSDAYGAMNEVLDSFRVRKLMLPETTVKQHVYEAQREEWSARVGVEHMDYWPSRNRFELDAGLVFRVLMPPPGVRYRHARQSSLVVHIAREARSLLFMGQAGAAIEQTALDMPVDWNADVLVVGKVNDPDVLSGPWLERVDPGLIMFSRRAFDREVLGAGPLLERLGLGGPREIHVISDREPVAIQL